jgi:MFS family permease
MTGEPAPGLRRNRNWLLLWTGQAISVTGTYIFNTTVLLWIATIIARDKSWGPQAVGGVLIAAAVPALVVGPVAGVFVDRWNRRHTMLVSDACCAVLIAALLLLPAVGASFAAGVKLAILYAVVAAVSGFSQFFGPSRTAVIQSVVAPADRARAMGFVQSMVSVAAIIGPADRRAAAVCLGRAVGTRHQCRIIRGLVRSYLADSSEARCAVRCRRAC